MSRTYRGDARRGSASTARVLAVVGLFLSVACGGHASGDAHTPAPAPAHAPTAPTTRGPAPSAGAVRIYQNGKIYTATTGAARYVSAIAVRDSKILRTGTDEALAREFPGAVHVDLRHKTVVPGLNDAHYHTGPAGPGATQLRFPTPDPAPAALREAIVAEAGKGPPHWVMAQVGLSVIEDASVDRAFLDSIAGGNPVFLSAFWGHEQILSSKALEALSLDDAVSDPHGGHFGRARGGKLDGRVFEYATWLATRPLAYLSTDADVSKNQERSLTEAVGFGLTSIQVMSWFRPEVYLRLAAGVQRSPRIRWITWPKSVDEPLGPAWSSDGTVTATGIKWILDGTPYEHGEALPFPYADGHAAAKPNFTQEDVHKFFGVARERHEQILFHAVGGVAIDQVLHEAESLPAAEVASMRPRIEHGDWMQPAQAAVAKKLGLVVVQNPAHFVDVGMLMRRRGPERRSMRLASLVHDGVHVALGSDGLVNPFLNIMFAVTHPYWPAEALSREEAVDAYTRESAYAERAEASKGTLEEGKLADFAVLSQDVFTCPVPELPKTRSVLTVVGGRTVWGAEADL